MTILDRKCCCSVNILLASTYIVFYKKLFLEFMFFAKFLPRAVFHIVDLSSGWSHNGTNFFFFKKLIFFII